MTFSWVHGLQPQGHRTRPANQPEGPFKRVGIDAFLTAFQFLTTMRDRSPQGDGMPLRDANGNPVSHLMGFLHRTATLLSMGIKPVYIFDGESPELKADEMAARRARRLEAEAVHKEALAAGDFALAQKMAARIMHYSPQMVEETQRLLDLMGVGDRRRGRGSPSRRDGCQRPTRRGRHPRLGRLALRFTRACSQPHGRRHQALRAVVHAQSIDLGEMLVSNELSREQLVDLAIMIGTDYHPGIKGIGPKTGLKLIKKHGTLEAVCEAKEREVPERLAEIREIFLNHPAVDVADEDLNQGQVDRKGLIQYLQEERQFSQRRMDQAFEKLKEGGYLREGGQTSLFSFDG